MILEGCAHATMRWIPAPRFHEDKLRGNDRRGYKGAVPAEGLGLSPSFPTIPKNGGQGVETES